MGGPSLIHLKPSLATQLILVENLSEHSTKMSEIEYDILFPIFEGSRYEGFISDPYSPSIRYNSADALMQ